MKLHELGSHHSLPAGEMTIPESAQALMGITLFWQPQMDRDYKPPRLTKKEKEKIARSERGIIWEKAHHLLDHIGQAKTKANLVKAFNSLNKKTK